MPAKVLPSEARPRRRERRAGGERGGASSHAAAVCAQANVRLYNSCRAHLVLLVELESKIKRLEYSRGARGRRCRPCRRRPRARASGCAATRRSGRGSAHITALGREY